MLRIRLMQISHYIVPNGNFAFTQIIKTRAKVREDSSFLYNSCNSPPDETRLMYKSLSLILGAKTCVEFPTANTSSLNSDSDAVRYLKTRNPRENPDFFYTRPEPKKWYPNPNPTGLLGTFVPETWKPGGKLRLF